MAGEANTPPDEVADGECYRVGGLPSGVWAGREGQLAVSIGGDWHFVTPRDGQWVFDRKLAQFVRFDDGWHHSTLPASAIGGAVVDAEARDLLAQVIDALAKLGLVALDPE